MLNVSHIQHFSTGDGDGIRTTLFLKGCNLSCPWCHNPENLDASPSVLHFRATGKTVTFGRLVTPEELLPELTEDKDFFDESHGGVTVSGGDAMLQAEELSRLTERLKALGISVLIDTAGCVPYSAFQRLNPTVSGYLFDFKTADEEQYRRIGGSLSLVSENLRRLLEDGVLVIVRIPLIPDFNCDPDSMAAICRHLSARGVRHVELLPFHRLGSSKYEAMGLEYAYRKQAPLSIEELRQIETTYRQYFTVKTEK